jgi:hypothetical protein
LIKTVSVAGLNTPSPLSRYSVTCDTPVTSFPVPDPVRVRLFRMAEEPEGFVTLICNTGTSWDPCRAVDPEGELGPNPTDRMSGVAVEVAVWVKVAVSVAVDVCVKVDVEVKVKIGVSVLVEVWVAVRVNVIVAVCVEVKEAVAVRVKVAVEVGLAVKVGVTVKVKVGCRVPVGVKVMVEV